MLKLKILKREAMFFLAKIFGRTIISNEMKRGHEVTLISKVFFGRFYIVKEIIERA